MFWGYGQTKDYVLTDTVTDWFPIRDRSERTEISQNDDNFVDDSAKLDAARTEESVAME